MFFPHYFDSVKLTTTIYYSSGVNQHLKIMQVLHIRSPTW